MIHTLERISLVLVVLSIGFVVVDFTRPAKKDRGGAGMWVIASWVWPLLFLWIVVTESLKRLGFFGTLNGPVTQNPRQYMTREVWTQHRKGAFFWGKWVRPATYVISDDEAYGTTGVGIRTSCWIGFGKTDGRGLTIGHASEDHS